MKTIEEAATDFSKDIRENSLTGNNAGKQQYQVGRKIGFNAGVEFAQRWIPVEEELPESGNNVLVKLSKPDYNSLIKDAKVESIAIAYVNCYNQFITSMMNNWESDFITHWRSIELI